MPVARKPGPRGPSDLILKGSRASVRINKQQSLTMAVRVMKALRLPAWQRSTRALLGGRHRTLEIEFRVGPPYTSGNEVPPPPPSRVIHYSNVPRYVFTTVTRCTPPTTTDR
jgi:hypothetical protein